MKESVFAQEMKASFERLSATFYMKIPDSYGMQRFASVKHFDAFMIRLGRFVALEYKLVHGKKSFPFNRVRQSQIDSLLKIHKAGGDSYIVVNFREKGYNIVLALRIDEFIRLQEEYEKLGRKSIPWKHIEKSFNYDKTNEQGMPRSFGAFLTRKKYDNGTFWSVENL